MTTSRRKSSFTIQGARFTDLKNSNISVHGNTSTSGLEAQPLQEVALYIDRWRNDEVELPHNSTP